MNLPNEAAILVGTPIVTGLVEVAKRTGMPDRYAPAAAFGAAAPVTAAIATTSDWRAGLLTLLCIGLAASGLYSQAKSLKETTSAAGN